MTKPILTILLVCFCASSVGAAERAAAPAIAAKAPATAALPFSEGVMAGDTFYVAGHIGVDPVTKKAALDPEVEARLVMESVKHTLEQAGLRIDDLVSVTVYCTDLDLYDKFNAVYRGFFHGRFPARAFIGVNKLVLGAHFEVAGIAAQQSSSRKP